MLCSVASSCEAYLSHQGLGFWCSGDLVSTARNTLIGGGGVSNSYKCGYVDPSS